MDIELKIEKLVFGGDGLGFVDGKACFVERALPGEKILARILSDKPNFMKAKLLRVLEASPHRIIPPCPYIGRCGGCQYQDLPYPEELKWKERQVRESFAQAFKAEKISFFPIQHGSKEYGYRTSITIHRTTEKNHKPQRLGFIGHDNHSKVLIDYCMLADGRLKEIFTAEHKLNRREEKRGFKLDERGWIFTNDEEKLYRVRIGGRPLWASSMGFFQNNIEVTELIAKKLAEYLGALKPSRFLDLYAGVGTFPLLACSSPSPFLHTTSDGSVLRRISSPPGKERGLAEGVPEVHCFEDSPYSTGCLRRNVKEWGLPLAGIFAGKVEKTFPRFMLRSPKPGTLVFMDPPRQGIASSLADFLARENAVENILYLACDLPILLRDLKQILAAGRYKIREVIPFDMFPRTKHIEVLTHLQRT
jgi:tRNA/tmRNA/rRNA uracil-C5-methylase (TrmA/RlmC/RlmD family)